MYPFRDRFSSLKLMRQTTTYEGLHLFREGVSLLAESLLDLHGKEGELIAYDVLQGLLATNQRPVMEVAEFLSSFATDPEVPTRQTAGLEYERIRLSDSEVVIHVKECEWARYFQERHPRVGYLMACSMDESSYRAVHPRIRMQRTSTLMEGGELCDFRIYAVDPDLS